MNIKGITIDGIWKEQPNAVKQEFLSLFQDRFAKPSERRANIDTRFPKTISEDQRDIVNEVQSAFIAERQMLDSPFILNEILQWCTKKKKKTLIFKVNFEKAFDSLMGFFKMMFLKEFPFQV
ncbi:hypothetical protein Tco_1485055 [Tanacetum coccineum]